VEEVEKYFRERKEKIK